MNRVCYYIDVGNRCMQENVRTKIAAGEETERGGGGGSCCYINGGQ